MSNVSEFERNKPRGTYAAMMKAKEKYETLLKETVIMEDTDAVRVEMARHFLRDLKEIFQKFKSGE
jgi:hypothetical protein